MGYFSNSSEGEAYERTYCAHCRHQNDEQGCPVMLAHLIHGYADCNNPDSILHLLIPRTPDGHNAECGLFLPRGPATRVVREA